MLFEDERNREAVVDFGIDPANTLSVAGNVHLREHRRVTRIDRRRISPIRRRSIAALHCSAFNYGQLIRQIHGQFDLYIPFDQSSCARPPTRRFANSQIVTFAILLRSARAAAWIY